VSISTAPIVVDSHQLQSNILVNDNNEASLIDMGLSRVLLQSGFTTGVVSVTIRYAAFELIGGYNGEEDEEISRVTEATDVWGFSMTVVEVRTHQLYLAVCSGQADGEMASRS
jgi:serine/threonine protein kinase